MIKRHKEPWHCNNCETPLPPGIFEVQEWEGKLLFLCPRCARQCARLKVARSLEGVNFVETSPPEARMRTLPEARPITQLKTILTSEGRKKAKLSRYDE